MSCLKPLLYYVFLQPLLCEECCIQSKVTAHYVRSSYVKSVGVVSESCVMTNDNKYTLKVTEALSGLHLTIAFDAVSKMFVPLVFIGVG